MSTMKVGETENAHRSGGSYGLSASPTAGHPLTGDPRASFAILGAALILGIAGDALLRAGPWGINLALWMGLLAAAAYGVSRWSDLPTPHPLLIAAWITLGSLMAWRDSPSLKAATILALAVVTVVGVLHAHGVEVRRGGIGRYVRAALWTAAGAAGGTALLVGRDIPWPPLASRHYKNTYAVIRGVFLAAPLLLLFGALLASADAVFGGLVDGMVTLDIPLLLSHVVPAALVAWVCGGLLRLLLLRAGGNMAEVERPHRITLGVVEVVIALGALNALFLVFVAVQVRYLFGGSQQVTVAGSALTYAEYARSGFFELVTVAGLLLPVLMLIHWLVEGERVRERAFTWLAAIQLVLLAAILGSAARRMWLYQQAYGLTELRLYTSAAMVWLAIVFTWFAATVLRGRRNRFTFGAVIAGLVVLGGLHIVNPDATVVQTNLERLRQGKPFDAAYAASLSGDAVVALIPALPALTPAARCTAATGLLRRWSHDTGDWRSWSWGRSRGRAAVEDHRRELRSTCPEAAAAGRPGANARAVGDGAGYAPPPR